MLTLLRHCSKCFTKYNSFNFNMLFPMLTPSILQFRDDAKGIFYDACLAT